MLLTLIACVAPSEQEIQVAAASSLRDSFAALKDHYEQDVSEPEVQLNFAGSQVLRLQIEQGARADLFASANVSHVQSLVSSKHFQQSAPFASNQLVVIVPLDNPAGISEFGDLPKAKRLVVGTPTVPIGTYAQQVLAKARSELGPSFDVSVVSEENNARLVRAKVELGVADAAIVYQTDLNEKVRGITIPESLNVHATYTMGFDSPSPFGDFVLSEQGREILREHGFGVP